jgi:hypothetical protein
MVSRIEHRFDFRHAVDDVLSALSDEAVLRARLERLGGHGAELLEHADQGDEVRYRLRQGLAAEQLPNAVRSLHRGDLVVWREQTWRPGRDGYSGTASAEVGGVPGEIRARTELTGDDDGALLRITGEVTVRIPLVGAKLESVIAEQVGNLLRRESEFTEQWLVQHGE